MAGGVFDTELRPSVWEHCKIRCSHQHSPDGAAMAEDKSNMRSNIVPTRVDRIMVKLIIALLCVPCADAQLRRWMKGGKGQSCNKVCLMMCILALWIYYFCKTQRLKYQESKKQVIRRIQKRKLGINRCRYWYQVFRSRQKHAHRKHRKESDTPCFHHRDYENSST